MNYETLYAFGLATAALAISPGPDNIYVMVQSIVNGKKYGMATLTGLISGCVVHTTLLAFGVSALLKSNDRVYFIIKLLGALYLIYLAVKVYRSKIALDDFNHTAPKKSLGALYKQGFIMNVLNPKVTIFFLAFFPGFLFSKELGLVWQFYILGGLFMLVSFVIFSALALLAGSISSHFTKHRNAGGYLKWLQILVYVGIAVYIVLSDK